MKFRIDSMKPGTSSILGNQRNMRYPQNNTPKLFRPKCRPIPLGEPSEPATSEAPLSTTPGPKSEVPPQSPQVEQQVKQLQFWLRVFSRFCHDDTVQE